MQRWHHAENTFPGTQPSLEPCMMLAAHKQGFMNPTQKHISHCGGNPFAAAYDFGAKTRQAALAPTVQGSVG